MQINRVQNTQQTSFNAKLKPVIDFDGKVAELLEPVRKEIQKGKVPAYLSEYFTSGKNGKNQIMVQMGLYTLPGYQSAKAVPLEEATPSALSKIYFELQAAFKKELQNREGKGAFKNFLEAINDCPWFRL